MLSRSSASGSLSALLPATQTMKNDEDRDGKAGAGANTRAARINHEDEAARIEVDPLADTPPGSAPLSPALSIQQQQRPTFPRQHSASSAKSLTSRLQQHSKPSAPSVSSSASSGKTVTLPESDPMIIASNRWSAGSNGSNAQLLPSVNNSVRHSTGPGGSAPSRVSTRPSSKRASSYTSGPALAPLPPASQHQSPPATTSPLPQPAEKLEGLLAAPARGHSSSISLPLSQEEANRHHYYVQQRIPSSLRTEWKDPIITGESVGLPIPSSGSHGSAAPMRKWSSDGYEQSGDNELSSDPSAPSSFASHNGFYQPFPHNAGQPSTSYAPPSPSHLSTSMGASSYTFPASVFRASSSPPRARDYAMTQNTHISPLTASNIRAKGKERSRQTSASSYLGDADADPDASMDVDHDTGTDLGTTDLASDAGNVPWDVRETDKLRSAKDALGRKMINQYARVAEIGRGVHGRVWLCEDTETGDFYAIKCVNRENRKMKSLKRSQAEAEANRRRLFEHDDEGDTSIAHGAQANDRAEDNSFDDDMQLNNLSAELERQRSANRKKQIVMDDKVKQEIAIMKRCHHEHVVQLREVIDDRRSKKIFMVLEYMPGGQIDWTKDNQPTMTVDESRRVFRDVVLGLEYLHYQGIIHRDIKPANLLWTQDRNTVKISDFGVSHVSEALARSSAANPDGGKVGLTDDRALRKTEGSPAFFAPELCAASESTPVATPVNEVEPSANRPDYFRRQSSLSNERPRSSGSRSGELSGFSPQTLTSSKRPTPPNRESTMTITTISPPLSAQQQQAHRIRARERPIVGKGIDIWALGVTLYCLLFGFTPFHEATSEYELYNMIPKKEIAIPPTMGSDRFMTGSGVGQQSLETNKDFTEGREVVDLLARLLEKDPTKRIQLHEVKKHPWVLRNLENSQGWLQEHDLAETRVVSVTEEEVQHATAERTEPQETTGIKASFKRFGEMFGLGGQSFLRKSARRDRSKSVSSTSASITTNSAWDGRSEPSASRTASRQASIVKKKPSAYSTRSGPDEAALANDHQDLDPNGLVSHALALKRKLVNAKAARDAHEAALSVSSSSPPDRLESLHDQRRQDALSRSLSGESTGARSVDNEPKASRRQSLGHLLQPPPAMQRRVSGGTLDAYRQSTHADPLPASQPNSTRPSLSSSSSRPVSQYSVTTGESDAEGHLTGRLRNMWQKIRSGSRTPAPGTPRSKSSATTPAIQRGQVRALSTGSTNRVAIVGVLESADRTMTPGQHPSKAANVSSPGSTRRPSAEFPIFSPASSDSRPSSQDTDPDARPSLVSGDLSAKLAVAAATAGRLPPSGKAGYVPQRGGPALVDDAISDSSDSSLDDFDEDEDYGEALSPMDQEEQGGSTQPSSYGHPPAPIMWSDSSQGWQTSTGLSGDPLDRFFRQQRSRGASDAGAIFAGSQEAGEPLSMVTPEANPAVPSPRAINGSVSGKALRPPISRDGSIHKDFNARIPPPSPSHKKDIGHVADDEDDDEDEEEEEVMIKPRSRLRRGTNASNGGSGPTTARPSLPASPRQSLYQPLLPM